MSSYPSTSSGRTGLEQSREVQSAAFTAEPDEASGRTGLEQFREVQSPSTLLRINSTFTGGLFYFRQITFTHAAITFVRAAS
jgi:hypothetical protein